MSNVPANQENLKVLANQIKLSDKEAYKQLFELLWDAMEIYARSILDNDDVAKDLLQDVWLDYWKRRAEINAKNIKTYLYSALRNRCYKYLRDNKLTQIQIEVVDSVIMEDFDLSDEENWITRKERLQASLAELPERCREIFLLSRINGLSNDEIAHTFSIAKKTVENQIHTATKKLKQNLSKFNTIFFNLF